MACRGQFRAIAGTFFAVLVWCVAAAAADEHDIRDALVEVADLPGRPRLIWDPTSEPPRPLAFVRDHSSGESDTPFAYWVALRELYRDGKIQERYVWPGLQVKEWMGDHRSEGIVRLSAPSHFAPQLQERSIRTPALATQNVHTAGLFEVVASEPGLDWEGLPLSMLTLRPLEWFRAPSQVEGPYFVLVPLARVTVGPLTIVDLNAEQPYSSFFRPQPAVGDQLIVLESLDPDGPTRLLASRGYDFRNLAVLSRAGKVEFYAGGFPLSGVDPNRDRGQGSPSPDEMIEAMRALFAGEMSHAPALGPVPHEARGIEKVRRLLAVVDREEVAEVAGHERVGTA